MGDFRSCIAQLRGLCASCPCP